jgi:hypothetical protein
MWHTVRTPDGNWLQFGNVKGQAGNPGKFVSIASAGFSGGQFNGHLHVVGITDDGGMWHTVRTPDGNWLQFGNVKGQAGNPGKFVSVGAASFNV